MESPKDWRVDGGQYLGEISALCFLHVPSHFSSLPYLLAGSGSQILLFDVNLGRQIKSFNVFEGVRVHGIASGLINCRENALSQSITFRVVISGERIVKLYTLSLQLGSESLDKPDVTTELTFLQMLPRFTHWVLDFCFLKDDLSSSEEGCRYLSVGCNDNSVHIWDVLTSNFIIEVACPERCLLYSMKFWSHDLRALLIASGTIFNEIVVWKLVCQHCTQPSTNAGQDPIAMRVYDDIHPLDCLHYKVEVISKLVGHQGSIFCLSWSSDGSKLVSVSDDRSARMWITNAEMNMTDDLTKLHGHYSAGPVLFGHGARIWDCCISDSFIVTAGEDCSCRVWGLDGKELRVIKEHIGRGIWRCLYDPNTCLLVTAGFDSAIKAHFLHSLEESNKEVRERKVEVFRTCIPNSSGHIVLMDSKSEYVRCLKFARKHMIYVATNHGYVYHVKLSESGSAQWTELIRITEEVPVICMDLLSRNLSDLSLEVEDWIAVGDGRGVMKVIKVVFTDGAPQVAVRISWSAEMERQLLGAYWCKSLGCRFIFTSNPRGMVKLWRLPDSLSHDGVRNCDVNLVAHFMSPYGSRIMCMDASFEEEVLVCGDLRGNLVLFPLSKRILLDSSILSIEKIHLTYFKGAHGISTVCSISIARLSSSLVEVCSTGADGCICYLEYNREQRTVEFVGMRHTKELSLVQSVSSYHNSLGDSANISYAVGFSSTDFLIWNLLSETKVLQVKCGGWRRPYSYYLGHSPEICSGFAYVKDEIIYVHSYWVPDGENKMFPRNLHLQFHGREIHSLCFIPEDIQCATDFIHSKLSWVATACEGGSVRLTRYNHGTCNWAMSNLLGEHVGGSAVRSLCFVSKIHSAEAKVVEATNGTCENNNSAENIDNPCLLISVGAKRVLTSWLLRKRQNFEGEASAGGLENKCGDLYSSPGEMSSISFKWLSSDMPVKCVRTKKRAQNSGNITRPSDKVPSSDSVSSSVDVELKQLGDALDNDWRYLAVTAFLVNVAKSRFTVCFVVVACSDATLTLRALVLPYRYWFDVASLAPLSSPVLALQHAVAPVCQIYQGTMTTKDIYIVISGSTDGSIAFWDVTESIEAFMQRVTSLHLEKSIDFQKRPRTGRGSQGGRWWKSVGAALTAKETSTDSVVLKDKIISIDDAVADESPETTMLNGKGLSPNHIERASSKAGESLEDSCDKISAIKPFHILHNFHQSGVNCLHIGCQDTGNSLPYSIVSGGDDQALNFLQFVVLPSPSRINLDHIGKEGDAISNSGSPEHTNQCDLNQSYSVKFLYQSKALAAHSSAVKGVWTDGIWIFSTGLDQRVRCWKIEEHGSLAERGHFIISVPEPEDLDVKACGGNCYQIAVAGRGMQMVEISLSS